ncbi:putative superoxide dismutase copper chaperone Lys7 [Dactylonectria macrodidyma]|uniref:Superoxide dismutase 1 copper chaperone n=1 Tax=Dactylonectria macrodidyma TaxID=307937 RepID=A0A9P9EPF8_9HYPO|nr:putative superoxide dismutase copper chaperone Lys7 [Dactylonectria macrodidyma]
MAPKITPPRALAAASLCLVAGYSAYRYASSRSSNSKDIPPATASGKKTVDNSFETLFAVPLSCDGCIKSVSDSVYKIDGISKVEGNLKDQLISVEGTAAPSAIVEAIQATGRDAILRGSGASDSAAVSILESFATTKQETNADEPNREVRGLARMVQVSSGRTLVDLTIRGVSPGTYRASIREYGNLADGARSTGPVWAGGEKATRGALGVVEVGKDGRGSAFVNHPFQIWEVIGHAMVLTRQEEGTEPLHNDLDTVVGVIARSAGMWDNDKTVCSCTGKTLWDERRDEVKKGML